MNANDHSTRALIERADRGDRSAIGRLLERHRARLTAAVAARIDRRLAARVDPSDIVQEALAEAGKRIPEYLRDRPVGWFPWLWRLTLQRLVDVQRFHLRSRKRSVAREWPGLGRSSSRLLECLTAGSTSPSGHAIRAEERAEVQAALVRLKEADRRVLELRYYQGKSFAEIAAALGIGLGAAKKRHLRALERFNGLISGTAGESR